MFAAETESLNTDRMRKTLFHRQGQPLTYSEVLGLWRGNTRIRLGGMSSALSAKRNPLQPWLALQRVLLIQFGS